MKILYLVSNAEHTHCYGSDHLFAGFCGLLGFENVYDWPQKANLHLVSLADRDPCMIDSDQAWPTRGYQIEDIAPLCDLAVLAFQPFINQADAANVRYALSKIPRSVPITALDASDHTQDFSGRYGELIDRRLAGYFKREVPLSMPDRDGYYPFPLSYPQSRCRPPVNRPNVIFYHASSHVGPDEGPGMPRHQICQRLTQSVPANRLDVDLYPGNEGFGRRMTPEAYHERMAQCGIGISWNGAQNWDSNRFWENFAYGLCQVAERPRIKMPEPFEDDVHCFYATEPNEAAGLAARLTENPDMMMRVAAAGYSHFLAHHTSEKRAEMMIEIAGKI